MIKAIVFDFDGVLVDSEPLHFRAIAEVMQPLGLNMSYERYLEHYVGFDDRDLIRVCLAELAGMKDADPGRAAGIVDDRRLRELIELKAQAFDRLAGEGVPTIPGVAEFLEQVDGVLPLAVASGATRRDIDLILSGLGWSKRFEAIVSADDVAHSKPAPQTYMQAVRQLAARHLDLALDPGQCLAIEDTAAGIASARAAGLVALGLTTTGPAQHLHQAHRVTHNFLGLTLAKLREWFA